MFKFFIISSLCLFLSFTSVFAGQPDPKLHQDCLYPTIYVGRSDRTSYGSGVIIRCDKVKDGLYKNGFISCGHLVDGNTNDYEVKLFIYENWSELKETKTYPAVFYGSSKSADISVGFFYSEQEMPVAQMDFSPQLFIGNEVYRIGCGLGDEPRIDYGKITSQHKKSLQRQLYRTSIYTVPGDSGSPLFHENKVIGIMISIRIHRKNMLFNISYAVPLSCFKNWDNDVDFIWDHKKPMPSMPFFYLNIKTDYEVKKK